MDVLAGFVHVDCHQSPFSPDKQNTGSDLLHHSVNFSTARVLLAHGNVTTANLYDSILRSFGARHIEIARDIAETEHRLATARVDLAVLDLSIGGHEVHRVVAAIRQKTVDEERNIPVLITGGHTRESDILGFRDTGANLVMTLPFSIEGLYDRLAWLALTPRMFVTADKYQGPCRRHVRDPLGAMAGRRATDRPASRRLSG